jgi:hypothetical protein
MLRYLVLEARREPHPRTYALMRGPQSLVRHRPIEMLRGGAQLPSGALCLGLERNGRAVEG